MSEESGAMNNRTVFLRTDVRASATYARAIMMFNQKRDLLAQISVLNQELRDLQFLDGDAVAAARLDVPFRNSPGRKKSS